MSNQNDEVAKATQVHQNLPTRHREVLKKNVGFNTLNT